MKAQWGRGGIPLLFLSPGHKVGVDGERHALATLPLQKDLLPIVQEADIIK